MLWVTKFSTLPGGSTDYFRPGMSLRDCSLCCLWMAIDSLWVGSTHMHTHTHALMLISTHLSPWGLLCCLLSHGLPSNASSLGLAGVCSAFSALGTCWALPGPPPCSVAWTLSPNSKVGQMWVPPHSSLRDHYPVQPKVQCQKLDFVHFVQVFSSFKWEANFNPFLVSSRGFPNVFFTVFPFGSSFPGCHTGCGSSQAELSGKQVGRRAEGLPRGPAIILPGLLLTPHHISWVL